MCQRMFLDSDVGEAWMATHALNSRQFLTKVPFAASVTILCQSFTLLSAVGDEVALDKVPAAITKAANEAAPKTKWMSAYQEVDGGMVSYELDGQDSQGHDVNVVLTADAKVTVVELQIDLKQVPQPVRTTVMAKLPSFKPAAAFVIRRGSDLVHKEPTEQIVAVDGTVESDREVSIQITPEGKIASLEREIDVAELPVAVRNAIKKKLSSFEAILAYEFSEGGSVTRYVVEGVRPRAGKTGEGGVEISVRVSADGKEVHVDES
jgi:hypothetical protein